KQEQFETNGLKVTTVDVSGTYVAETAPGSGTFHNNAGYRLRAAVVETPNGSYYVKLVGPEKTVAQWNESFLSYLKSFQLRYVNTRTFHRKAKRMQVTSLRVVL